MEGGSANGHGMSMCTDSSLDQPLGGRRENTSPCPPAGEAPPRWLGLRIMQDGTWLYRGSPINRIELVRLFASVLRREADGSFWLVTPVERGRIEVDDAPFVAVELAATGAGRSQTVRLRTNLDEWLTLGPRHPLRLRRPANQATDAGPVPYVEVRAGLEARLARPVYYELVERGEERLEHGRQRFGVWSEGVFFPLDQAWASRPRP
jgi:uncharacterized protein